MVSAAVARAEAALAAVVLEAAERVVAAREVAWWEAVAMVEEAWEEVERAAEATALAAKATVVVAVLEVAAREAVAEVMAVEETVVAAVMVRAKEDWVVVEEKAEWAAMGCSMLASSRVCSRPWRPERRRSSRRARARCGGSCFA